MALHLVTIVIMAVSLVPIAAKAQIDAEWNGEDGKWSDKAKWTCYKEPGGEPCVPNGSQYAVHIDNGKVNVDIDVSSVAEVVSYGTGALFISGHLLSATLISGLASVELENKAEIHTDLGLIISGGSLTMRDSSISGGAVGVVNLTAPSTGILRAFGSSIQQLALRGSIEMSNSTVGMDTGPRSGLVIESESNITNSRFIGDLLVDNGGSLTLRNSQFTVPSGSNLVIGYSGVGSMEAYQSSQITVAEGASTQIGMAPSGSGRLTLDEEAAFTSNDRVSVADGGTGSLVLRNGGTLSAGDLLLGNDGTVRFDVSPGTIINVRGRATLLGNIEVLQSQSFESGAFLPLLRTTETNIPTIPGHKGPYLRLARSSPQQFTAIDMAGSPIGHLSFALPNNTAGPVLVPTVCRGSLRGCAQGKEIFIGVVATNGAPVLKTSLYKSRPTGGIVGGEKPCQFGIVTEFSIIASAGTQSGKPISMGVAAAALGYDHFNFVQTFTQDPEASTLRTIAGTPPSVPYVDPPPKGWVDPGVADSWPFYYDEFYSKHVPSPTEPEYINVYFYNDSLDLGGNDSPDTSFGFLFFDSLCRSLHSEVQANTQLFGVTGTGCNVTGAASTSNCSWEPISGTGWLWSISNATLHPSRIP